MIKSIPIILMLMLFLPNAAAKNDLQVSYIPVIKDGTGVVILVENLGDKAINNLSVSLDIPIELQVPYAQTDFYIAKLEPTEETSFKMLLRRGNVDRDLPFSTKLVHDDGIMIINFIVPKILFDSVPLKGIAIVFGSFLIGLAMFAAYYKCKK